MKNLFTAALLLVVSLLNAQNRLTEFPGSGFGLNLPDSNYKFYETRFSRNSPKCGFTLVNQELNISSLPYQVWSEKILKEILVPGVSVVSNDSLPDGNRLLRVEGNFGDTNANDKGVVWFYFYKHENLTLLVTGEYELKDEKALGRSTRQSLLSFCKMP